MANTKLKYLIGVTSDASANLQLWVNNKFATLPHKPRTKNNKKSMCVGITQSPNKIVLKPNKVQSNVK